MKTFIATAIVATLAALSLCAIADIDYSRLRKDVSVMTQILKSAFSSDENCRRCRIQVDGTYLAEQGIVFTVHGAETVWFAADDGDGMFSYSFEHDLGDMEALENIPHVVGKIVTDVTDGLQDIPEVSHIVEMVNDSTRDAMRDIRRSRRDVQQEIREREIELIHLEDDERKAVESQIAELEGKLRELENQEREIAEKLREDREKYRRELEEKRRAREEQRAERQREIEGHVLQAFCDYGSTLRSLPSSQKVTVIFEGARGKDRSDTVYVFDRGDVTDCNRDSDRMVSKALKYQF